MTRIIVTGGTGLFGCTLVPCLRSAGHQVRSLGRGAQADIVADLRHGDSVHRALEDADPDVVVNLAAFTDVDGCEDDPQPPTCRTSWPCSILPTGSGRAPANT